MLIQIDLQKDIPLYEQLCNSIIYAIATGELTPGESLPTVRQLSADLGINMHTVSKSYNILKQKGFLNINRSKGATVNTRDIHSVTADSVSSIAEQLKPTIAECIARGMTNSEIKDMTASIISEIKGENK